MVYSKSFGDSSEDDKTIVYDLRQIYAKDIVGETLKHIKFARVSEDYVLWYHLLKRDLFTEISQKLTDQEKKDIRMQIEKTRQIIYNHKMAFQKLSSKPHEHENIEDALCELEMLMTKIMEIHKMYGSKEDDEGL